MICGVKEIRRNSIEINPNLNIELEIYVKKKNHLCAKYAKTKIVF